LPVGQSRGNGPLRSADDDGYNFRFRDELFGGIATDLFRPEISIIISHLGELLAWALVIGGADLFQAFYCLNLLRIF